MNVFLTWNPRAEGIDAIIHGLCGSLEGICTDSSLSQDYAEPSSLNEFAKKDGDKIVITLGGDGTVFRVVQKLAEINRLDIPILPVNLYGIGFLSELHFRQLEEIPGLLKGQRKTKELPLYEISVKGRQKYFINDLVISTVHSTGVIDIRLSVDGMEDITISGDGVIVSSKLGSTAYNMSASGPVLLSENIVVTPLDPFAPVSPLVLPDTSEVKLKVTRHKENTSMTYDGIVLEGVRDDEITVKKSDNKVNIVRFHDENPIRDLKELMKLKAGKL